MPPSAAQRDRRFARLFIEAFKRAGHQTSEEIAAAGGPSTSWMSVARAVASGNTPFPHELKPATFRKIDSAAKWPDGTALRVYEGAEPPDRDVPVGAGVDPGVLADLTDDETAKVLDYVAMLKAARKD